MVYRELGGYRQKCGFLNAIDTDGHRLTQMKKINLSELKKRKNQRKSVS